MVFKKESGPSQGSRNPLQTLSIASALASSLLLSSVNFARQASEEKQGGESPPAQKDPERKLSPEEKKVLEALRKNRREVDNKTEAAREKSAQVELVGARFAAEQAVKGGQEHLERVNHAFRKGMVIAAQDISRAINAEFNSGYDVRYDPEDILSELVVQSGINACFELGEDPTPFVRNLSQAILDEAGLTLGEAAAKPFREILEADPEASLDRGTLKRFGASFVKHGKDILKGHVLEIALSEVSGLARGLFCSRDEITWFVISRIAINQTATSVGQKALQAETYEEAVRMWDEFDAMRDQHWEDFKADLARCWDPQENTPLENYVEIIEEGTRVTRDQLKSTYRQFQDEMGGALPRSGPGPIPQMPQTPGDGTQQEIRPIRK